MQILGIPYPIVSSPGGLLNTAKGASAVKADLMQLILTNPGERVMMSNYGTNLRKLIFEQNDGSIFEKIRSAIIEAINNWEPRVVLQEVVVGNAEGQFTGKITDASSVVTGKKVALSNLFQTDSNGNFISTSGNTQLNSNEIYIKIRFISPYQIDAVESLELRIPTGVNNV